ncbi:MAG: TRAM domain-containing protein [Candidatus Hydrogenedentota bacterium]
MNPTVKITGMAHGGHGVGRIEGQVCFVEYALPGDVVAVDIVRRSKGVLWAVITDIVEPSPHRVEAGCSVFGTCGGCQWLSFEYPAQAEWKCQIVRDCFQRIGKLRVDPEWADDPDLYLGYRTRAEFHEKHGAVGFYERGSHNVVDIASCPLCHEKLNGVLGQIREARPAQSVDVTVNPEGEDVLVWTRRPSESLERLFPQYDWGRENDARHGFMFDGIPVVNGAFSQSSLLLNRVLLEVVQSLVGRPASLLDLYCGNGNLSLGLAHEGVEVLGMDREEAAVGVADAVGPGAYQAGDEGDFVNAMDRSEWGVILLDPPRSGAKAIASQLAQARADAIVYVSCDAATQARDAAVFCKAGWHVARTVVVDMFPNTWHVETVCRFER